MEDALHSIFYLCYFVHFVRSLPLAWKYLSESAKVGRTPMGGNSGELDCSFCVNHDVCQSSLHDSPLHQNNQIWQYPVCASMLHVNLGEYGSSCLVI